ncbi:MAG TPA: DUF2279 domain-containing protein [Flavobacteriales bacterium]|nr:DUF2279 domain-containing protein [Flavobacteriales bacterium]HMR27268.1 DUF2279 domain-containing protein [Flavobacteriales bacterium]
MFRRGSGRAAGERHGFRSTGLLAVLFVFGHASAQTAASDPDVHRGRLAAVSGAGVAVMAGSLIGLNEAWYAQYERSRFHGFNDGAEWLQMDKAGHVFSSYWIGRWGQGLMRAAGVPQRQAAWVGAGTSLVFLTGVEVLDGFSAGWGFSGWDMMANAAGAGLFLGQELAWGQQRVKVKYSVWPGPYAAQRPDLLGASFAEQVLKDYNAQTIWLTLSAGAVRRRASAWGWLGLALGHGGDGMLTAEAEPGDGRFRQVLLAVDVDLERIPVRGKAWRTVLFLLNCIKLPSPAIEWRSDGRLMLHGLYF